MRHLLAAATLLLAPALVRAQAPPAPTPVIAVPATTLPLKHAPEPTSAEITVADLMTRLYILADDSMMGREAGTIGNVRGTDYIAREAARIGLVPMGDSGTYFQTLPFRTRSVDSASTFAVGGVPLAFGRDWTGRGRASASNPVLQVVYGGVLGDSATTASADQVAGKLAVYVMPEGAAGTRAARNASSMAPTAAAVAVIVPDQYIAMLSRPTIFVADPSSAPPATARPLVLLTNAAAAKLFDTPVGQLTAGTAGRTAALDLRMREEPVPYPARNVIGVLPGSDPALRGQYVALGAHNDHIGMTARPVDHDSLRLFNHVVRPGGAEDAGRQATPDQQARVNAALTAWRASHPDSARPDSISNGADDDGSGSVSVLEVAEKIASLRQRPKRSIIFIWHVGEEKGLLGSAYFTDHPTVPRDSIVTQLNLDMVGRGDSGDVTGSTKNGQLLRGNPNYLQVVGSRRLSSELGDLIEAVNRGGKHNLAFDYAMDANGHPMNIYCRSDHYEYARYGIPIAFFTTGGHSDYHQVSDEPQYIDYAHMARVDNLVEDIAVHVANLDHRPFVDHPKPDPRGACRQ